MDSERISVARATPEQLPVVLRLVQRLLMELSDDPAEFDGWDPARVRPALETAGDRFAARVRTVESTAETASFSPGPS